MKRFLAALAATLFLASQTFAQTPIRDQIIADWQAHGVMLGHIQRDISDLLDANVRLQKEITDLKTENQKLKEAPTP